LFRDNV